MVGWLIEHRRVGYGKELNYPGYLGQCMVGRVSYLDGVKQGDYHPCVIYHTEPKVHTSQTLSFHNNLSYPPSYFGFPDWEYVTRCKYQHYPTLDTYLSLSFSDQKRIAAFQPFNIALFKTNFNFMFFLN